MKCPSFFGYLRTALVVAGAFSMAANAQAQTFITLANFNGYNGLAPEGLIQGLNGNFYGVTLEGGKAGAGNVFEVSSSGKITEVYSFCSLTLCADGSFPSASLLLGADGDFYATTYYGGGTSTGSGTVFRMTMDGKLTTIYIFCETGPCNDGVYPVGLVQASSGNFYGATNSGGSGGSGTLFEVNSVGAFKLLYTFCSVQDCADGATPYAGPIQANNGNLYGTTGLGGSLGAGVVYEMTPTGNYRVLHSFCSQAGCADGSEPVAGLVQGANGNLYGAAIFGGTYGNGSIFEISPKGGFRVVHSFEGFEGESPIAALTLASDGTLYGTTSTDTNTGAGTIFQITSANAFKLLSNFCPSSGCEGTTPGSSLVQGTSGTLYGTTTLGGSYDYGTVFSFANGLNPLVATVPAAGKIGTRVIILGNGLTGSTSVTFNGFSASYTVVSNTEITATVPTGATTGEVTVTTPTGALNSNPAFQVIE